MNFLDFKDFNDMVLKTGMTPEKAREYLLAECKTRGLI